MNWSMTGWNMPRRSARNTAKEVENKEEHVSEDTKHQSISVVADVIDDFVAEAESQDAFENDGDKEKSQSEEEKERLEKVFRCFGKLNLRILYT